MKQFLSESSVSFQSLKMASKFVQMVLNPHLDNRCLDFKRTITEGKQGQGEKGGRGHRQDYRMQASGAASQTGLNIQEG